MGIPGGKLEAAAPALGVEAGGDGDGLHQRGFSHPVFPDKKGDRAAEMQFLHRTAGRPRR